MYASGFVVIDPGRGELAKAPVLGVPLALWGVRALRHALPLDAIFLVGADAALGAIANRIGVASIPPPPPSMGLMFDAMRPFCTPGAVERAMQRSDPRIGHSQDSPIESVKISDDASLELARALARGLAPDHPAIAGVTRFRLPLATDIRAIVSDVDGCLTDGGIAYFGAPEAGRTFNTHDGYAHGMLAAAGIKVGWLSATSNAASIERRATQLRVPTVDAGAGDKGPRFLALCEKLGVAPAQTVYLGDDLNDLPAMRLAGLTACPADAPPVIRNRVDLILDAKGGRGAFRELADVVLAGSAAG
jgi:YrbI family 3-deoxy-D-manno-octulosonate 8-phosphate phosphatase